MKTMKLTGFTLALALSAGLLASCSDDDNNNNNTTLPPIGGYNNAGEVGSADLVAYWPLNGNGTESISNTEASTAVGASYVNTTKGQGLKLTNGYLAYPAIANLSASIPSITVSLWAKITNNAVTDPVTGNATDGHPIMLFNLSRPAEWAGNVNFFAESGRLATNDTIQMKALVVTKREDGTANFQDNVNSPNPSPADLADGHTGNPNKNGGTWAHYVMVWDGPTGTLKIFANGQKISNNKYEVRNGGDALPLNFFTPTKPIIGTFQTVLDGNPDGWQRPANTEIDEIRVWKKSLSGADINSLYELEKAGR